MRIVARLLVLLPLLWVEGVRAVDCPSNNYDLNTQAEVDALGAVGCDTVTGNLSVYGSTDITNLDGLLTLKNVSGTLDINVNDALDNLDGLANINSIGGSMYIRYNRALTNIDGVSGVASVGDRLVIAYNDALFNIDGFVSL